MSLDYTGLVSALNNLLQTDGSADFTAILPNIIDDAEQRIYRELNFVSQRSTQELTTSSGARSLTLNFPASSLNCVVVEQVGLVIPAGADVPSGTVVQYQGPVSHDFINMVWPQYGSVQAPSLYASGYWATVNSTTLILAPTPDGSYTARITGVFRPVPMSASNPTTYLGTTYPDLFLSACMVFAAGWQRDFGAQSEDPKLAASWEAHYGAERASALEEEARRRGESTGWTPMKQYVAQPPRT